MSDKPKVDNSVINYLGEMPLAGFHCIAEKIQDSLSLVDEYRLVY